MARLELSVGDEVLIYPEGIEGIADDPEGNIMRLYGVVVDIVRNDVFAVPDLELDGEDFECRPMKFPLEKVWRVDDPERPHDIFTGHQI